MCPPFVIPSTTRTASIAPLEELMFPLDNIHPDKLEKLQMDAEELLEDMRQEEEPSWWLEDNDG
jgi:hypothetical protein